jgi:hypothetical protein
MPMPPYPVLCYTPGCGLPAAYKIAAHWSDGVTGELKTYGLACADCLPAWLRRARERRAACHLAPGETLDAPAVFRLERGRRDQQLERMIELEGPSADGSSPEEPDA